MDRRMRHLLNPAGAGLFRHFAMIDFRFSNGLGGVQGSLDDSLVGRRGTMMP